MDSNALGDWLWRSLLGLADIAPLGALGVVILAYFSYRQKTRADRDTIRQRTEADNRNSWWSRVQWAVDASLSGDEQRRATGLAAIVEMQDSPWATDADRELLAAMAVNVQDEEIEDIESTLNEASSLLPSVAGGTEIGDNGENEGGV